MESGSRKPGCRGRKRRRKDTTDNSCVDEETSTVSRKRASQSRPKALLGQYVKREFAGSGVFLGKVVSYDSGLYRVDYEDGDCEDLEATELWDCVVNPSGFDNVWIARKRKLDALLRNKDLKKRTIPEADVGDAAADRSEVVEGSPCEVSSALDHEDGGDLVNYDADSCSDSCEHAKDSSLQAEISLPPLQLPSSSGNIGVPEEYVSDVLSVYTFLRSFSTRLFLSPFSLDDFVGSLNCSVQNTLTDSIIFALMRALKRHLEMLSSEGSLLAAKCLRCFNWSLIDALTWPVYLVNYLVVMGYVKGTEWKGFPTNMLDREYYALPVGTKLMILQILSDDALESAELRAEIDMREELEVGCDSDAVLTNYVENGPRRVHPRFSKTSACSDREVVAIIPDKKNPVSACRSNSINLTDLELSVAADAELDGNVDECRLCGMDGTLLCCDGCPSAYHSRCIGVMKMYIPDGSWFCPECSINKVGPIITKDTALRGGEVFGVDHCGQFLLGTCNHLLVLKDSVKIASCVRYYKYNDIPKVLHALCSSVGHATVYLDICKKIACYWNIQDNIFCARDIGSSFRRLDMEKEGENSLNRDCEIIEIPGNAGNLAASNAATIVPTLVASHPEDNRLSDSDNLERIKSESVISTSSQANPSTAIEVATCASGNSTQSRSDVTNINAMPPPVVISFQSFESNLESGGKGGFDSIKEDMYLGSSFRTHAYINYYIHGDFAASAAASLAVIASEENHVSDAYTSDSRRKVSSATISLQIKAFSSAALRFFWPNAEKKLVDIPRERCGWCLSCKAPPSSKRACLLNSAALNATRGIMKAISGIRSLRNGEGCIASIATYMLYMEESLCGFVLGPFLNADFRKLWRQHVEKSSSFSELKGSLLKLEKNINLLALSADWLKLVDLWLIGPVTQTTSVTGPIQKRGPGRRRKHFSTPEVTVEYTYEKPTNFSWWRDGKVSKHIFQKATLPNSLLKRVVRIGGTKKITGLCYTESSEIPKRSWQTVWRAAVEMSRTASQLALQVRYLDDHIKWGELVRPDPNVVDNRVAETEAFAFRNARISDKRVVENNVQYEVAFDNQKHLPSCVLKNIVGMETGRDGNDTYWFLETYIPLYMIKEYEEKMNILVPPKQKQQKLLSDKQKMQMKASRRDIFQYLVFKRDKEEKCACVSCNEDVLLGLAVKCGSCEGYCHATCTISSTLTGNAEHALRTCGRCCIAGSLTEVKHHDESPISSLPSRGQVHDKVENVTMSRQRVVFKTTAVLKNCSETKAAGTDSSLDGRNPRRMYSWGIIWKKKKNEEDMDPNFRINNIILKGNPGMNRAKPVCHLCQKPYNSDLMYICCEICDNWAHADALEIDETKIPDIFGYKCCKCRRIKSPDCPYADAEVRAKRSSSKRTSKRTPKLRVSKQESSQENLYRPENGKHLPQVVIYRDDSMFDPFSRNEDVAQPLTPLETDSMDLFPETPRIETENSDRSMHTILGAQKLPIRRHTKQLDDNSPCGSELHAPVVPNHQDMNFEWDASNSSLGDVEQGHAEYEPQTYFSLTELLSADDTTFDDHDMGMDLSREWAPPASYKIQCAVCLRADPDFSCKICGVSIHSYCSPWLEDGVYPVNGWRCGECRGWR